MNYSLEKIYNIAGKDDLAAGVTFKEGSEAYKIYGSFISCVFLYTQKERESLNRNLQENCSNSGIVKAKYLGTELSEEITNFLKAEGVNSDDIIEIFISFSSSENKYHSDKIRTIKTLKIPTTLLPKGGDLDWMYGFNKRLVTDGIGLCPRERHFYLAAKYYYEPDELTQEELNEMYNRYKLDESIELEYLGIKYMRENISDEEKIRSSELYGKMKRHRYNILDQYLNQSGSSIRKLAKENIEQAAELLYKVYSFREQRLNAIGSIPIYISLDSYLHIYMRHVEEFRVNSHFEHKDNFQWDEENVKTVMEHVIKETNQDIQVFFKSNPSRRYSRYGDHSVYFQGDYYTFHIEFNGRISTFYKNNRA